MTASLMAAGGAYDFQMKDIDGHEVSLAKFKSKAVLFVNVASKCGFTPQYEGLEALYEKYKEKGLVIVGVPANNFGGQEPGSNAEIKQFCKRTYDVTFPMLAKVSVKGTDITPLYTWFTDKATHPDTGGDVKWNFTKFLVNADGTVVARFESPVKPDAPELVQAVEKLLK